MPPSAPNKPKKKRKKLLLRLLLVVGVLLVAGLAAFTWFAYWPLEGDVDDMEGLVPEGVDFVYRAYWKDLKSSAWFEQNVAKGAFLPDVEKARKDFEERTVQKLHDELEGPINQAIPFGITKFSVEDDVFPAETIVAGRFCEDWGPERGRPLQPKEWIVLTRTSWKVRFVSALKHEFVRNRLGGVRADTEDEEGVFRLQIPGIPVTDVRMRSGCGGGFVIAPEDLLYLTRVKDVLALSNSKALIRDVAELGRTDDENRSIKARRDFRLEASRSGLATAIDLVPLHKYLIRVLETGGPAVGFLDRFLTIRALDRFIGNLEVPSPDVALAKGEILYDRTNLAPEVEKVFSLSPASVRAEGIARLVPAEDTFAVLFLRSNPVHLMTTVWEEFLAPGDRALVLDNIRRQGKYQRIEDFFKELGERVGETSAIAVGRLSDVYDKVEYRDWYNDPVTDPDPQLAAALWVHLRQSVEPKEVDDFLADRLVALGLKKEVRRETYRGVPYARLEIEQKSADFSQATPAYMLIQDHLVISTNEGYFRKIIDTMSGGPSLAADATFQATMNLVAETANVAAFVDLSKVLRIPPGIEPGGTPRGFLWDKRNLWVLTNRDEREEAIRFRNNLLQVYMNQRKVPSAQQQAEIETQVEGHIAEWQARYPQFLEEYRQDLDKWKRLRAVGMTFTAGRDVLTGRFAVLLQPSGG